MFLNWLKDRDYEVVLSSSWRIPTAFADFTQHLKDNGLSWIAETPRYTQPVFTRRGVEIEAVLSGLNPQAYTILDDYGPSEFLKHQRPYLVQTSNAKGLEQKKLDAMDRILR